MDLGCRSGIWVYCTRSVAEQNLVVAECDETSSSRVEHGVYLYRYADTVVSGAWPLVELSPAESVASGGTTMAIGILNAPLSEPADTDWIHHWPPEGGGLSLALSSKGEGFVLRFPGLADFAISTDGLQIGAWPAPLTNTETLRHLLLDQVLPRVLAHQGRLVLHAGAVQVGCQAIAFIGDTGRGKSTLTASFHAAGFPLLSDDGLVLTRGDRFTLALPTYPSLRLWPAAIASLYARPPACAPMAHYSAKQRVVMTDVAAAASNPLPLAALYVLASEAKMDGARISLTSLSPREACMAIIRNSFQLDVTDARRAAAMLATASRIAQQLPVFTLTFPRDFARLPDVRDAILKERGQWTISDNDNPVSA